ncbi:MAG: hypothetical protein AAF518_28990 [Spirochaetota bacterium]
MQITIDLPDNLLLLQNKEELVYDIRACLKTKLQALAACPW